MRLDEDPEGPIEGLAAAVLGVVRGAMLLLGPDNRVRGANREFCRIFRIAEGEAVGRPVFELAGRQWDVPRLRHLIEAAHASPSPLLDFEVTHDFERIGPRNLVLNAVRVGEGGGPRSLLIAVEDAGERRPARETAWDAGGRMDEFLAMLAHELRNPLAPIRSAVYLLRLSDASGPDLVEIREILERQVGNLARLIDGLLDVSRITRGRIELNLQPADLCEVVRQSVRASAPAAAARGHRIELALSEAPLGLLADPVRIEQVCTNILNNAVKYTDPGGHILVSARAEGGEAVLSVRDDGPGIAASDLGRVFDLFAQADRPLDRGQGGLGVGLTVVRGLVALHGGEVEVRSEGLGRGTELIVRLPLRRDPWAPGAAGVPACGPAALPRLRVLVVEDHADGAVMLARALALQGHEVRVVHDGLTALEEACRFRPGVVLADIGLPGIDGYEMARRLREQPEMEGVRLVAVSGYGRDEDEAMSKRAGFDLHVTKPLDPGVLPLLLSSIGGPPPDSTVGGG